MANLRLDKLTHSRMIDVDTFEVKHEVKWNSVENNIEIVEDRDIQIDTDIKDEQFLINVSAFAGRKPFSSDTELAFVNTFIDEAYVAVTSRWVHLKDAPLSFFQKTKKVNLMFARLVALCLRTSAAISGKKYELDKLYMRINLEKKKVMNYFRNIKYDPVPKELSILKRSLSELQPIKRV